MPIGTDRRWRTWSRHRLEAGDYVVEVFAPTAAAWPATHSPPSPAPRRHAAALTARPGPSLSRPSTGDPMERIKASLARLRALRAGAAAVVLGPDRDLRQPARAPPAGRRRADRRRAAAGAAPADAGRGHAARSACASTARPAASPACAEGPAVMLPFIHELRRYSLRDQVYRRRAARRPTARRLPDRRGTVVRRRGQRALRAGSRPRRRDGQAAARRRRQGSDRADRRRRLHRALSKHTVREVFTDKRVEIQDEIEQELRGLLARDGIVVRTLFLGHVDLPAQYRAAWSRCCPRSWRPRRCATRWS